MKDWSNYIIVQAGGKGSRLGYLTENRPKCLVPVQNRPMLFHLFEQFPDSRFIIIGDTHFDVLERYLKVYARVNYDLVRSTGYKGTLAGLGIALEQLPQEQPFIYVWSDLVLPMNLKLPEQAGNYIGIGIGLPCRWKFEEGAITEQPSSSHGIAGLFLIQDKQILGRLPAEGQFVKYISAFPEKFRPWYIDGLREYGLLATYEAEARPICRPFNAMEFREDCVTKRPITAKGESLAAREQAWYRHVRDYNIAIPAINSYNPLVMERIEGATVADARPDSQEDREAIVRQILDRIRELHESEQAPYDAYSYQDNYIDKTLKRLDEVSSLIPFADQEIITINGVQCRNPLFHKDKLATLFAPYRPEAFHLIHGDATFSNIMLRPDGEIVLIDPRGYFGNTEIHGDRAYDYAKLYYSIAGNYDSFNKKKFRLKIGSDGVAFYIESGGWENTAEILYESLPENITPEQIRLIHAIIWLSLTTYAWEDYDSICGAFYNGTMLFEEALREHNL